MSEPIYIAEYSPIGDVLDLLDDEDFPWLDNEFKSMFVKKYSAISLDILEQFNIFLFEVMHRYKNSDKYIYDVCNTIVQSCSTMRSRAYLLDKLGSYTSNEWNIITFITSLEKYAQSSMDYIYLVKAQKHVYIATVGLKAKDWLDEASALATSALDNFMIAVYYYNDNEYPEGANVYLDEGLRILAKTTDGIHAMEIFREVMDEFEFEHGIGTFPVEWSQRFTNVLDIGHL